MSCCRKHFTITDTANPKTKKLRVLARLYSQMRQGTDIQPGDWLEIKTTKNKVFRLIYMGSTPISRQTPFKSFCDDCKLLNRTNRSGSFNCTVPINGYFQAKDVTSFEIIAPFAYH